MGMCMQSKRGLPLVTGTWQQRGVQPYQRQEAAKVRSECWGERQESRESIPTKRLQMLGSGVGVRRQAGRPTAQQTVLVTGMWQRRGGQPYQRQEAAKVRGELWGM